MIKIEKYSKDKQKLWDDFVNNSKTPMFMFNRNFMEYHSDRFVDNSLMFYNDKDELVAVLPASIHGQQIRSHGGLTYGGFFVNDTMKQHTMNDCLSSLVEYLGANNINHFIYKSVPTIYNILPAEEYMWPLWQAGFKLERTDVSSVIDLQNQLKMPKGRKAQISRAKREGVEIVESSDFNTFIDLENSVLSLRHGVRAVHTGAELKLLKSRFPENIKLFVAKYKEQMIAGTLLFIYPNVVHTQYMAANEVAREIGGLDLLIKTLIDKYTESKKWFDFGISTEQGGEVFNEGLCAQKEGFGARTIAYNFYEWKQGKGR